MAQVIAKLLPLQLLRGVGLEQRQHVHLARKSLVEAVNADQIPDLYGSHVPCLQATMHGLPNMSETVEMVIIALLMILMTLSFYLCAILKASF
ncbi:hypothetical protein ABMD17_004436 [Salmonella enterica]